MPVYGQSTELNQRLSSLISCIFCNSNDLYDGIDQSIKFPASVTPSRLNSRRPLFSDAILRKASRLEEIRMKTKSSGVVSNTTTTVLEIVLVANQEDSARCNLLANLVSHLFAMPEEHTDNLRLEVTSVRSNAIREDLSTACSSRSPTSNDSAVNKQRRRIFVGLGSALQGLCLYLHQEEVTRLRLRCSRDTAPKIDSESLPLSKPCILAVVCIDPPPHLWNSCGKSILEQTSFQGIPSFFISYTEKDEEGAEQLPKSLGELLNECKRYPHTLALVAREAAKILRSSNSKNEKNDFDACVWTAKLITKYAESIQRIRTPPGSPPSGTIQGNDIVSVRSKL